MKHYLSKRTWLACGVAAACLVGASTVARAQQIEIDGNTLLHAGEYTGDWMMYHRTYNAWHYSPLDQINTSNVKDLKVAWMHNPGASPHGGIQSMPLAIDGRLYYTIANDQNSVYI